MITPRFSTSVSRRRALAGVAGGGVALATARLAAQGTTPVANGTHPFVGVWMISSEGDDGPPEFGVVTADGGFVNYTADGEVNIGVWAPSGDSTADMTIRGTIPGEEGSNGGLFVIRVAIEVDATGESFAGPYTLEIMNPDGTGTGQYGPSSVTGTRLVAEPMGEPVGSLEDLFGQFEGGGEPGATPEGGSAERGEVVHVGLGEFFITTSMPTLDVGKAYTFMAMNSGQMVHELVIEPAGAEDEPLEADDRESEIEDIGPGTNAELTWTFEEAGMYQFACHIEGHYEAGMVLEFEVVG